MADTKLTALSAITSLSADDLLYAVDDPGGSPASSKITALNALSMLFGLGMVSISGAATATIGRMHYCTGTSYTLGLPTAVGVGGKLLGVVMAPLASLTGIVTLDGSGSETIDGALTRIMNALEVAILLSDNANWFKIAGKSIPMCATLQRASTDQTGIVDDTWTQVSYDTLVTGGNALLWDSGNGRASIVRPNQMIATTFHYLQVATPTANYSGAALNAVVPQNGYGQSAGPPCFYTTSYAVAAGDYIKGCIFKHAGSNSSIYGAAAPASMDLIEVCKW